MDVKQGNQPPFPLAQEIAAPQPTTARAAYENLMVAQHGYAAEVPSQAATTTERRWAYPRRQGTLLRR